MMKYPIRLSIGYYTRRLGGIMNDVGISDMFFSSHHVVIQEL